jgi:flagellar protein FliO/FliZ
METAQPMSAAETEAPAATRSADTVIYPQGSPDRPAAAGADGERGGASKFFLAGAFMLALGGGWLLLRRRGLPLTRATRTERLIAVEETKSLGNRQYLVVACCEGRRFLIGVTPGRIQLLSPLDDREPDSDLETPAAS